MSYLTRPEISTSSGKPIRQGRVLATLVGCLAWVVLACAIPNACPARLQPQSDLSTSANGSSIVSDADEQSVKEARSSLTGRIKSLEISINSLRESAASTWLVDSYRLEHDQLKYLDIVYAEHESLITMVKSAESDDDAIDTEIRRFHDQQVASGESATFTEFEALCSAIDTQSSRVRTVRAELATGESLAEVLRDRLGESERKRRRLVDEVESSNPSLAMKKIQRELVTAKLASEVSQATLDKQELDIKYRRIRLAAAEQRMQTLEFLHESMKDYVSFTQQDLDLQLEQIASKEATLRDELASIQSQLELLDTDPFQTAANSESTSSIERAQILDSIQALRENLQLRMSYVNATLSELVILQHCWNVRFDISQGRASDEQIADTRELTEAFQSRLSGTRELIELQLSEARNNHEEVSAKIEKERSKQSVLVPWFEMRFEASDALLDVGNKRLAHIQSTEKFFARLSSEIDETTGAGTKGSRLLAFASSLGGWWTYEIFAVDDNPITLGKLTSAILMLVLGIFFSKKLSRIVGCRMLPRLGMHKGASLATQTIVFYALTVCFVFFTLEMLNIPLTVFTFLGGAAAIAVGFGSQTLLNNFMSGLIILGEQPVRVGDLVEIDGVQGNISHIGARSTKIKTGANIEIIVPNSKFMENHLINWTLSNTEIRTQVNVGVAYGSPTDLVFQLLEDSLKDNADVLRNPEPIILFSEFGNDALQFELHFWIHMKTVMEGEKVESNVRRSIDRLFRQNNVTIAFPQRDVHLDINQPIEVSLGDKKIFRAPRVAA